MIEYYLHLKYSNFCLSICLLDFLVLKFQSIRVTCKDFTQFTIKTLQNVYFHCSSTTDYTFHSTKMYTAFASLEQTAELKYSNILAKKTFCQQFKVTQTLTGVDDITWHQMLYQKSRTMKGPVTCKIFKKIIAHVASSMLS